MIEAPAPDETQKTEKGLVLDSLEVKNFRAFRHLKIEKLGRVNLITGKNNVGKTSLLEALALFARRASPGALHTVIKQRKPSQFDQTPQAVTDKIPVNGLGNEIIYLFHNADYRFAISNRQDLHFSISGGGNYYVDVSTNWHETESFKFGVTVQYPQTDRYAGMSRLYHPSRVEEDDAARALYEDESAVRCTYIGTSGLDAHELSRLWDSAYMAGRDSEVVECLRVISLNIKRVGLRDEVGAGTLRTPFVVDHTDTARPAHLFGEGFRRLLEIAIAAVQANEGILLVDEIENGLHYSVLPDIWRFIFQTARRLNVQVFATTHSWDCIRAFSIAASEAQDPDSGMLIRLLKKGDDIFATLFDREDLDVVTESGIEVR